MGCRGRCDEVNQICQFNRDIARNERICPGLVESRRRRNRSVQRIVSLRNLRQGVCADLALNHKRDIIAVSGVSDRFNCGKAIIRDLLLAGCASGQTERENGEDGKECFHVVLGVGGVD